MTRARWLRLGHHGAGVLLSTTPMSPSDMCRLSRFVSDNKTLLPARGRVQAELLNLRHNTGHIVLSVVLVLTMWQCPVTLSPVHQWSRGGYLMDLTCGGRGHLVDLALVSVQDPGTGVVGVRVATLMIGGLVPRSTILTPSLHH